MATDPIWWRYVVIVGENIHVTRETLQEARDTADQLADQHPDVPVLICQRISGVMVKLIKQREQLPTPRV